MRAIEFHGGNGTMSIVPKTDKRGRKGNPRTPTKYFQETWRYSFSYSVKAMQNDQPSVQQHKRLLSKGPSPIWIGLSDGRYLSDLVGRSYEIEDLCLNIDLSRNFRVHNKRTPVYAEICALMKAPTLMTLFQIRDLLVIEGLGEILPSKTTLAELALIVREVEDKRIFRYSISELAKGRDSLYLKVGFCQIGTLPRA